MKYHRQPLYDTGFGAHLLYRFPLLQFIHGRRPHVILIAAALTCEWKNVGIIWSGRAG